ncbi:hypothetical protein EU537_00230 [Candidatus Thorarchaeota archaeon]|nr:MAG: hypothetical protein EU537_00230 [Candidatus Thorarchaeota archaeon]
MALKNSLFTALHSHAYLDGAFSYLFLQLSPTVAGRIEQPPIQSTWFNPHFNSTVVIITFERPFFPRGPTDGTPMNHLSDLAFREFLWIG